MENSGRLDTDLIDRDELLRRPSVGLFQTVVTHSVIFFYGFRPTSSPGNISAAHARPSFARAVYVTLPVFHRRCSNRPNALASL